MADFNTAYKKLVPIEGGYVNNPLDRGKETYKGISRHFHPNWAGWNVINALRREPGFPRNLNNHPQLQEMVLSFFKIEFWNKFSADKIISQAVADELFDTAVNMNYTVAIKFAQSALNLLNKNGKLYADILVDGVMGFNTITAINNFSETPHLLRALNVLQGARYISICENNPTQEEFFRGWLTRAVVQ